MLKNDNGLGEKAASPTSFIAVKLKIFTSMPRMESPRPRKENEDRICNTMIVPELTRARKGFETRLSSGLIGLKKVILKNVLS